MPTNFERMIQLADEVFASRQDPNQLDVNEAVLDHLREIHPAAVSQFEDSNGPVAWLLLIPTTRDLMEQFLENKITENELYLRTPLGVSYESIYLCSAMVLEEYRRKGIMKKISVESVKAIMQNHPIQSLFVWTFSDEGLRSAQALARDLSLPLYHRKREGTIA